MANKTNRASGETADTGGMRVLLYDVESSPNVAYVWGKYEQNAIGDFIKERQIISVAWKWLDKSEAHTAALPDFDSYRRDPDNNRDLILKLHSVMGQADIVVGHNVCGFDDRMVNTDFIKHGLPPPPPHKTIDTLKIARKHFRFNSNKLDDLGAFLGCGRKVKHEGFSMWVKCLGGDMAAWAQMVRYNKGDVRLLEKIYLKLRPWITNHPGLNAGDQNPGCPSCRCLDLERRGWGYTKFGKTRRFQCNGCGKWSRGDMVNGQWRYA